MKNGLPPVASRIVALSSAIADAASLAIGSYRGIVCVDTNGADPDEPRVAVPFSLDVVEQIDLIFEDDFEAAP